MAGQLPERGHVERLVEGAVVDRGLAEVADRHLVGVAVLGGERHAGRERDVPADDAVPAEEPERGVEEVHRAALAPAAARGLAEQLGHDGARADPARQRVAVLAVGAGDVVVRAQGREAADRDRLLPDVEVAEAADLAEAVGLAGLLLEVADEHHLPEPAAVLVRPGGIEAARGACWPWGRRCRPSAGAPGGSAPAPTHGRTSG